MATPLNIIGGWYSDAAKPWSQQDICNYIPFVAEQPGTLSPVKAVDAPGLKPFVEIASNGGVRGMENVEGKLLVVAGTTLYQISNTGVAIPRGTIPGTGRVSIDYNQAGIANQVLIGNGSAGYVYNTSTLTLERITDPAFPGTKAVAYLDSYLLGVEPLGRFWFHSNLADAEDYNALDRYESETAPDRIVTLKVSNEEVVVFNQTTTDFFVNTGATTGTFQSKGVSMNVGCASAASVVELDNTLFWLDNFGIPQRLNSYSPQPCTTRVLEALIGSKNADGSPKFDWSRCVGNTYQDRGRKIVYWTFPEGLTIGYDVTTGLCHRRAAYGLNGRDRLSCIVNWNRKWLGGDYLNGRLYELDWDYMLQVDQPHVRRICTMPLQRNGNRLNLHRLKLQFDTGGPETIAIPFPEQPEGPTIIAPPLPDGAVDEVWAGGTYTATGGTPPYTYTSRTGTTFPTGLGPMSGGGVVPSTTPSVSGTGVNIARVTDANGLYDEVTDTFVIDPAPFPGVEPPTGIQVNGYALDVDIPLPATIEEDDLLVMQAACVTLGTTANTVSPVAGWTLIDELQQVNADTRHLRVGWYYKIADGTETGDVTVTGTQSCGWSGQIHRIEAGTYDPAEIPELEMEFTESPLNVTCPTVTPSWGSNSVLCIAAIGFKYNASDSIPDLYPLPYNQVAEVGVASGTAYSSVASSTGELSGASISPGDYHRDAGTSAILTTLVVKAAP